VTAPQLSVSIQGQGSVSADQLNTYLQGCDTVGQLRGFIGAPGVQVYVRGISAIGDGGQGSFSWVPNVIGTDDGTSIIVPVGAGSGYWERISVDGSSSNVISCTETGTNLLILTPINGIQQPFAYSNYQEFSFVAAATSTGAVTAQVVGFPIRGVYLANNTQAGSGAFVVGQFYVIAYNSALNGGLGGFSLFSGSSAGATVGTVTSVATAGLATGGPITSTGTVTVPAASAATTLVGTDATQALTAAGFAGNKTLTANGFYKFPGGLTIQWGSVTESGPVTGAVGLTTPFVSAFFSIVITPQSNCQVPPTAVPASLSSFTFGQTATTGAINYTWIAIGV
jgi:hypothetical protein